MLLKNFSKLNFGMFLFLFPDDVLEVGWRSCLEFEIEKCQNYIFKNFFRNIASKKSVAYIHSKSFQTSVSATIRNLCKRTRGPRTSLSKFFRRGHPPKSKTNNPCSVALQGLFHSIFYCSHWLQKLSNFFRSARRRSRATSVSVFLSAASPVCFTGCGCGCCCGCCWGCCWICSPHTSFCTGAGVATAGCIFFPASQSQILSFASHRGRPHRIIPKQKFL
jgi:hypothetical protein